MSIETYRSAIASYRRRHSFSWKTLLTVTLLACGAVLMVAPFVWIIQLAFTSNVAQVYEIPPRWFPATPTLNNFAEVFNQVPFERFMFNSLKVASAITIGQLVICSTGAFAFARLRFPGRDLLFILLLSGLMVPLQVTIVPLFSHYQRTHEADAIGQLLAHTVDGVILTVANAARSAADRSASARATASTCASVVSPSASASANWGTSSQACLRLRTLSAREAVDLVCAASSPSVSADSSSNRCVTRNSRWASIARTDVIAANSARQASTSANRPPSIKKRIRPTSIRTTVRRGYDRVDESGAVAGSVALPPTGTWWAVRGAPQRF